MLHSAELDVVDEDDTVDELDASAAVRITVVCNGLSKCNFLFSTGWCKSCAFCTPWCISQELDVSSATFARLARRKEGCMFIVAKGANADRDQQRVVKCSFDVSKRSDCLIINETAVVNAHPVQNINSEFTECSIGTDGDIPG